MKFRAKLSNVSLFLRICTVLGKVSKVCYMHMTPKHVKFVIAGGVTDALSLYAVMSSGTLFDDEHLESKSNNEIVLHVHLEQLERALKSCQSAANVSIKLSKRTITPGGGLASCTPNKASTTTDKPGSTQAVLTLDAQVQLPQYYNVTHDVPVEPVNAGSLALAEPKMGPPDVCINLPKIKGMGSVVDHLKNIADCATIRASLAGELSLEVQTAPVNIVVSYSDLDIVQHPGASPSSKTGGPAAQTHTGSGSSDNQSEGNGLHAKVELAKVAKFLQCHHVQPNKVCCSIYPGRSVVFYAILDDLYLAYYLPTIA